MGTSLTVGPFNTLLHRVPSSCPRLLINLERVGESSHPWEKGFDFDGSGGDGGVRRDVAWLGHSDEGVEELCRVIGEGWGEELRELREEGWKALGESQGADIGKEEKRVEVVKEVGEAVGREKEQKGDGLEGLTEKVEKVKLDDEDGKEEDSGEWEDATETVTPIDGGEPTKPSL